LQTPPVSGTFISPSTPIIRFSGIPMTRAHTSFEVKCTLLQLLNNTGSGSGNADADVLWNL
jgi:hypothetical protein